MTENYSGNINIREKPSMHKRQKFLLCKLFKFIIFEGKTNPLRKFTKPTNLRTKINPLKNCILNKIFGKSPHLQIYYKNVVRSANVNLYDLIPSQRTRTCFLYRSITRAVVQIYHTCNCTPFFLPHVWLYFLLTRVA
jgi:hypothetical protein